jgi:hypothetical protein
MLPRQRVKTVAHVVELLNFVQDRSRMHGYAAFLRAYGEKTSDGLTYFSEPERVRRGGLLNHNVRPVRYHCQTPSECWICSAALVRMPRIRRMIVIMMDANHISERLASMRQEMDDLRVINARYWVKSPHTALDKSAQGRLLGIKQELSDMIKRCA